ncbi:hypothetical protein [Dyadobacter luticola]|uniref:hypothetical protein n=1 Tax=Dyadobacter luticola TaxID=1979387 RepID=UPI0026BBF722|nr:hypothetical protein [Dyadobacter luticola]
MLTSEITYEGIISHYQIVKPTTIQLVDEISVEVYVQLRQTLFNTKLVQVIHVIDERSIEQGLMAAEYGADALLLDSGNPNLAIKELGGTGRIHNW